LSVGIVPSSLKRSSLPNGFVRSCAWAALAFLADADVELAVVAEMHAAAVVVGRARQVGQVDQGDLAAHGRDVAV
jgi:hypothetical protein